MGVHTKAKFEMGVHTKAKFEMGVHTKAKFEMGVHTKAKYEMGVQKTVARGSAITAYQSMVETLNQRSWRTEDTGHGVGPLRDWREGELIDDQMVPAPTTEEELQLPAGMTMEEFNEVFCQVGRGRLSGDLFGKSVAIKDYKGRAVCGSRPLFAPSGAGMPSDESSQRSCERASFGALEEVVGI